MKNKILVVGGGGYIGSACVQALIQDNYEVTVFDNFSTGQREKINQEAKVIVGDLLKAEALENLDKVCAEENFSAVIHFSAKKAVGESELNPSFYFQNNVVGSLNLLKIISEREIPKIIFSSTAAVYKENESEAFLDENSALSPLSVYGQTKLMIEEAIQAFFRTGKIKQFSILRYFNVAGDMGLNFQEKNPQNVFPIIANKIKNNEEFSIFGNDYQTKDGTCVRDYIHLKDLVAGHISALKSEKSGIFNLGTGSGYSVLDLVEAFNEVLEKEIKVAYAPRRPGDPAVVVAKVEKAKQELNWEAKHSLKEMVEDTLRVYLN